MPLRQTFRALRSRDFRLYFMGQGVSVIGSWMQMIAMSWLVYRLTDSPFLLGLITFSTQFPTMILTPLGGVYIDRCDKRRLLVVTQALLMLQALALAALTLAHVIAVWQIVLLSALMGVVNAFDMPGRQSFIVETIDRREDLSNAIALNSFLFNSARLVGPSLAGIVVALVGEGYCFLLNGLSFLAAIFALKSLRLRTQPAARATAHVLQVLQEGLRYIRASVPMRSLLILISLTTFFSMPATVLMPVFARDIHHGGPRTLGFLMGAFGVGALSGALYIAYQRDVCRIVRLIVPAALVFACGSMLFALSTSLTPALCFAALGGAGMMIEVSGSNTVLQTLVTDGMRGRVMSFFTLSFIGAMPLGSLVAGACATHFGAPRTLLGGGLGCLLSGLVLARHIAAPLPAALPTSAEPPVEDFELDL